MENSSAPDAIGKSAAGHGASPSSNGQPGPSSGPVASNTTTPTQKKLGKRERVALACQRCKTRKQKCDGSRPACGSCARLTLKCVYIVPLVPAAGEKKLYIKALEQRVAELEAHLASLDQFGVGDDHLRMGRHSTAGLSPFPHSVQSIGPLDPGPSDDEGNDILVAVRDLSLSASGHYVGATSNITIGRVLSSVVHSQRSIPLAVRDNPSPQDDDPTPKSICTTRPTDMIGVQLLSPQVAQRLLQGWFCHIATRYPVLHTPRVLELHNNRENLTDTVYEIPILHLIYAVSGRWLESAGEMGHFFSDQHYDIAFEAMDPILKLRDARTVDYLILMAVYCTRAPRDPGAWTYVGAAMRLCIELGLHRKQRRQVPSVQAEMNKRRFWTTYFLDRDISIAIGRPPSISDHDIDADLPLDVDEANNDDEVVRRVALHPPTFPVSPPNSLTSFVHRTRLKRIESEIQHLVYRVDRQSKVPDSIIQQFLDQLNAWKDVIPFEARNFVHQPGIPYDGIEFYTIHYYRCVRFLLYPQLAETPVNMQYLRLCADACAGVTSDYRRLHQVFPVGFSALSIQSVFLAGLTLIYCAWLAPPNFLNVDGPLTDCQILLYIVTERYPSARKYRDIFERIKTAIMSIIARGEHQPRNPVGVDADMRASCDAFEIESSWGLTGMGADFTQMISQMMGQGMDGFAAGAAGGPGGAGHGPGPGHGLGPGHGPGNPGHAGSSSVSGPGPAVTGPGIGNLWPGVHGMTPDGMPAMDPMGGIY